MPEQSTPTGAVFLSYASQDAEAAARICESLRAAGIEVWFDRSDLRGGDAWDAHIKKQIHECALFIPVISAQTNARAEGYFRREWKLATRRLMDLADDAAFLVPVVIDETRETDARVPEEFLDAQWTRLPGGATPPAYAERVRQLLGTGNAIEPATHAAHAHGRVPSRPGGASRLTRVGVVLTALLLVLGAGGFWYYQRTNVGATAQSAAGPASPDAVALNGKSIAVLPFVDLSPAKDQEYFSDGLAEDLLNLLAKLPELRVTSRSSAFAFKGQTLAMSEIAKRLNVAHVLEGSVRKAGNRVRVTAQLIEAHTDRNLWSESYDRDLNDIFAVQDEISAAVVDHLKVSLLGNEKPAARVDAKAFDIFLQARQFARLHTKEGYEKAVELYKQGLAIDGNYAPAWTVLAYCYRREANNSMRPLKEGYALARDAITRALKVDPDYAPAYGELSRIALDYDGDAAAAARHLEHAIALEPTSEVLGYAGALAQSLGRFDLGIALGDYAMKRDPLNPTIHNSQGVGLRLDGRPDEALVELRKVLELSPGDISAHYRIAEALLLKGDAKGALAASEQEPHEAWRLTGLALSNHALGRKKDSDQALAELIRKYADSWPYNVAYVYAWRHEPDLAFKYLEKAREVQDPSLSDVAFEQFFDNVHADPRWMPYLRSVSKAPEQLAAIKFDVKIPAE
jgi:TolB-like protein/Flp pilus assembly protein TadD